MQVTSGGPLAPIPHFFLGAPGSQNWSIPAGFTLLWSPLCLHSSFPLTSSGLRSESDTGLGDPLPSITGSQQGLQKQLEEAQCPGSATAGRNPLAAGVVGQGAFHGQVEDCLGTLASLQSPYQPSKVILPAKWFQIIRSIHLLALGICPFPQEGYF